MVAYVQQAINWLNSHASLVISMFALAFTLFSFYWMNLHRGRLRVGWPRAYEVGIMRDRAGTLPRTILRLPFVFFNPGAVPIILQNLQLVFPNEAHLHSFTFVATLKHFTVRDSENRVSIPADQERRLAYQIPVRGREAVAIICEFWGHEGEIVMLEPKMYDVELKVKLDKAKTWKPLLRFSLHVSQEAVNAGANGQFIVYNNDEDDRELAKAVMAEQT